MQNKFFLAYSKQKHKITRRTTKTKEYVEMPNLVGLSLVEACETLVSMGLNYELDGEGGMVVAQFPPTGTVLEKYSTVQISVANE